MQTGPQQLAATKKQQMQVTIFNELSFTDIYIYIYIYA